MSRLPSTTSVSAPAGQARVTVRARMLRVDGGVVTDAAPAQDAPCLGVPLESRFEVFFDREHDRLVRAMALITGSRWEAEDLAQAAFVKVFERWDHVSKMDAPAGYLHRTAMNLFRNQYRRARIALARVVRAVPPPDIYATVDDRDAVTRALGALTPRQRAALVLTEALGYSGEDAGRLLGVKGSTVFALTHQARTTLRRTTEVGDVD